MDDKSKYLIAHLFNSVGLYNQRMNTKLVAILAVIIVVAAGSAAYIVINNDDDGHYVSTDNTGRLAVYGNANNDDYLDNSDVEYLEKIIAGTEEETPLADANQDGKIDSADVDFVKGILNKTQKTVYVLQTYNKTAQVVSCKYPLTSVGVAGYETITVLQSIGAVDKIKILSGAGGDSFDKTFYSDVYDLPKCGKDVWNIDPELLPENVKLDGIIAMDSKSYLPNYQTFEKAGISVVRIQAAHALNSLSGIVTVGFLLGCEEKANELMEFFDGITDNIVKKVGTVSDENKVTGLFVTMTNYVEGPVDRSEYTGTMVIAGAKSLADKNTAPWGSDKARLQFKTGEEWLLNDDYQGDFIVHSRALGLKPLTSEQMQDQWNNYSQYFTKMSAYPDGYFILNSTLSPVLRIAVMATQFYPDLFGEDYAFDCIQQYYDKFITSISDFDAKTDATWLITANDVKI